MKIISKRQAEIYIDKYSYDMLKIIFTNEELIENKISKANFIVKEIIDAYITKSKDENAVMVFICQPIHEILSIIIQLSVILSNNEFNLIFIPGEIYEIIDFLSDNDLNYRFNIYNYNIDIIPIDNDLISLEKENNFIKLYLNEDISPINDFAISFLKLEACFGKIKHKYIKGSRAKIFNDILQQKENEANLQNTEEVFGMFVFDRNIDFITPFTSNYTYEGLIDENYGINKGNIIIDETYFSEKELKNGNSNYYKKMLYSLSSNTNEFFSKVRCMNYLDANKYLLQLRQYFSEKTKERKNNNDLQTIQKTIVDIKEFVEYYRGPILINTKFMTEIFNENIKEDNKIYRSKESTFLSGKIPLNIETFYGDYMSEKKDLIKILNLMCIESLTQEGIKNYNNLKRDILNIYGYQNLFLLRDLESMKLLKDKNLAKKSEMLLSYQQICSKLNLINPNFNKEKITDCSYIYQGYCPIILRLIELAIEGKWNKMKDLLNTIPGETIIPPDENEILKQNKKIKTIFVVFIGGISYTEIEGIRYINLKLKQMYDSSKENINSRIQLIIVTDEILNRKKIFNNLGKKFSQKYTYKKYYNDNRISTSDKK